MNALLEKIAYAKQAIVAAESGDIETAVLSFLAAHAIHQQQDGAESFHMEILTIYQFLRKYGIEASESELNAVLSRFDPENMVEKSDSDSHE